ncbi:Uncharacterised protein [Salmonella enterica subsp. enterica serovar Bovismorbificans]|uniref:Uncharacterized protein n=1 Tax=Salmonella enterica subsp. enterica serovar Bovismorbificans TaxID=58097 RepID=A0A655CFD9_SALET|nr:Uncharacterised protein [Salmonella enterica subsp. enterica serovar Bovismorbificans]CNU09241.1 Uncharacterised protein [Salmonella enterica subsp. enterica serovar Bovismorbificans]
MKLKTANAIRIMTYRHHHAVEMGVNGQPGRNITADQRMITRDR